VITILQENRAEMEIGQHFLEGEVVTLKSPLLIIGHDEQGSDNEKNIDYEITAIVKKRIIFKTRPKPIGLKRLRP